MPDLSCPSLELFLQWQYLQYKGQFVFYDSFEARQIEYNFLFSFSVKKCQLFLFNACIIWSKFKFHCIMIIYESMKIWKTTPVTTSQSYFIITQLSCNYSFMITLKRHVCPKWDCKNSLHDYDSVEEVSINYAIWSSLLTLF